MAVLSLIQAAGEGPDGKFLFLRRWGLLASGMGLERAKSGESGPEGSGMWLAQYRRRMDGRGLEAGTSLCLRVKFTRESEWRRPMRKLIVPAAMLAVCLMGSASRASIIGTAHDFGGTTWSGNQICAPCHTPHGAIQKDANGKVIAGPLWNHTLSTATYTLYLDSTGTGVTGDVDQNSKLCLSCHDGTVALDSFGGATGSTFIMADSKLGTDLSNDHPIGQHAVWQTPNPSYLVDPALRTAAGIMPLRPMADGRLAVGCTSCHEPHNRKTQKFLLWVKNDGPGTTVDGRAVSGSTLCMNCHKK